MTYSTIPLYSCLPALHYRKSILQEKGLCCSAHAVLRLSHCTALRGQDAAKHRTGGDTCSCPLCAVLYSIVLYCILL